MWRERSMIASISAGSSGYSVGSPPQMRHGRRAALVDGAQAIRQRQPIGQLAGVPLDGAADARQVAGVKRLQHQHERIALPPAKRLSELVADLVGGDVERKTHFDRSQTCLSVKRKQAGATRPEVSPMHDTIDADRRRAAGAADRPDPGTNPDRARDRSGARLAAGAPARGRATGAASSMATRRWRATRSCSRRSWAAGTAKNRRASPARSATGRCRAAAGASIRAAPRSCRSRV